MGLDIAMWYRDASAGNDVRVDILYPYSTLGGISDSMQFWGIPRIRQIGIEQLAELGKWSPIFIREWAGLHQLGRELALLSQHFDSIEYGPKDKVAWLANLTYCYHLLREVAPKDSVPTIMIG